MRRPDELEQKRTATIVRSPAQTLVDIPRPIGTVIIRAKTSKAVLRKIGRLQRRGYVYDASALARVSNRHGGGFAVKIALIKPLPQPMPGWAKGCALVGGVLCILSGMTILVLNAVASLFAAAALLPWALIIGGLVAAVVVAFLVKRLLGGGNSATMNNYF
jgi:hypothetical protein